MTFKKTLVYVGTFLKVNALVLLAPALVALYYSESVTPFIISAVLSYLVGIILTRESHADISYADAMIISSLSLLMVSLVGSVPYFTIVDGSMSTRLVDVFFESVSGYTTTGLSIIPDVSQIPKSMVFLRSIQQWIGGIGIVVLSISTLMYGLSTLYLYREEQDSNRIQPSVSQSSKMILKIYIFYTFAGTLLLWLVGLDFFSSLNNTMTALSTGGFSSGGPLFVNAASRIVLTLIMIAGSVAFTVHYQLFSGQIKEIWKNAEVKTFFLLLVTGSMIFTPLIHNMGVGLGDSVVESVFNVVSAITTTGYASVDLSKLSDFGKLILSFFMVIGGGMGSTSGGIKILRFIVLVYGMSWMVRKTISSTHAIIPLKISGRVFQLSEINSIFLFYFAYVSILFAGNIIISAFGYSAVDSLFISASAISTVGLSTLDVAIMPLTVKLVLILEMLFGRVEIISMAALIGLILKVPRLKR